MKVLAGTTLTTNYKRPLSGQQVKVKPGHSMEQGWMSPGINAWLCWPHGS